MYICLSLLSKVLTNYNFIMDYQKIDMNQSEMDVSFSKHNKQIQSEQDKLNTQILRVHTADKLRMLSQIWTLNQKDLCNFFNKYDPFPLQNFNMDQILDSPNLKLIKSDGKIYFGQISRQKRQGKGVLVYKQGKMYQGQFSENQRHGVGVQIYSNGNIYLGDFSSNKKHGKGRFFWFSLSAKIANPKNQNIEYYNGDWWSGLPDGQGMHQKLNGDLYIGSFKNGLKHGQGQQYFGNGDYYKGEYVNGFPEGFGQYIWQDGSIYKGDLRQGLRNGYGVWQLHKNSIQCYKGHYQNDKKSGYGVYQWQNGWTYKGNFHEDYRNGYGELYDGHQVVYRGYWENGQQNAREPHFQERSQGYPRATKSRDNKRYNKQASFSDRNHFNQEDSRQYVDKNYRYSSKDYIRQPINAKSFRTVDVSGIRSRQNQGRLMKMEPQMLKRKDFQIRKRPQSFTDLQKPRDERTIRKANQSISRSTIGSTISRPIMKGNYANNLYIPFKTSKR